MTTTNTTSDTTTPHTSCRTRTPDGGRDGGRDAVLLTNGTTEQQHKTVQSDATNYAYTSSSTTPDNNRDVVLLRTQTQTRTRDRYEHEHTKYKGLISTNGDGRTEHDHKMGCNNIIHTTINHTHTHTHTQYKNLVPRTHTHEL